MAENGNHHSHGMTTSNEFQQLLEDERQRADRRFGDFSLIIMTFNETDSRSFELRRLIKIIHRRKRTIDRLGWLDKNRIGLLLPNTSKAGAIKLATDLQDCIFCKKFSIVMSIYEYPHDWPIQTNDPLAMNGSDLKRHVDTCLYEDAIGDHEDHGESGRFPSKLFLNLYPPPLPWWKRSIDILGSVVFFSPWLAIDGANRRIH